MKAHHAVTLLVKNPDAYYEGPRPRLDVTDDFRVWLRQLRRALQGLRRIGYPVAKAGPPLSFQQAMRVLYRDSQFSVFIASRAWEQAGLGSGVGDALCQLQQQLDRFEEPDVDAQLVKDPAWQTILAQVVVVVALLV
jgi:hypothetical protein